LEYGVNCVVWQTLFSLPEIVPELVQHPRGVKRKYQPRRTDQDHDKTAKR